MQAVNVGIGKSNMDEDGGEENQIAGDDEEEKKFETKYLDPGLIKDKKKVNKDSSRLMKLSLTDGLNSIEAIEYERLKNLDYFDIGQKLIITPPVEVRRGILFLTNANVSYLGSPIITT